MVSIPLYIRTGKNGDRRYKLANIKKQEEGIYALRITDEQGKRRYETVGTSLKLALLAKLDRETKLLRGETLLPPVKPEPAPIPKPQKRATLAEIKQRFILYKKTQRHKDGTPLDGETVTAYSQHVDELLAACEESGHRYPEEVDGDDLRTMLDRLRQDDYAHNSICNHYTSVVCFLRYCGVDHKALLPYSERPTPEHDDPVAYTEEEVQKFFAACGNERYRLVFEFLLKVGARELEAAHLEWTDIRDDGRTATVKIENKRHLNHRTKTRKSRVVPLEHNLADKLAAWHRNNPKTKLVFGTEADKVDWHFLRACKSIARRAGFDESDWWTHKWRDTFCTWTLRRRPDLLRTVQKWAGHASITTTEKYLAPETGVAAQAGINDVFGGSQAMAGAA
jgi:integrase